MRKIRYFISGIPPFFISTIIIVPAGIIMKALFNCFKEGEQQKSTPQREVSAPALVSAIIPSIKIKAKEKEKEKKKEKNHEPSAPEPSEDENKGENDSSPPKEEDESKEKSPTQNKLEILLSTIHDDSIIKQSLMDYDQKQTLDLNSIWGAHEDTLLMHLIRGGYCESAKFVIEKIMAQQPFLINEINNQNQTALMVTCQTNQMTMLNYLLVKVPNLYTDLRDKWGDNALSIWLQFSAQPLKQTFSLAKKLIERGCGLIPAAYRAWNFASFSSAQQEELEILFAEQSGDAIEKTPTIELKDEKTVETPKHRRRKSLDTVKTPEKKEVSLKKKQRKLSLPIESEESKSPDTSFYQQNRRFSHLCIRNCQNLILAFFQTTTSPLEMFCRHTELLMQILDLAKNINFSSKSTTEKTALKDFIYYIRHSIPQLLKAGLLPKAPAAVETIAAQLIEWMPVSLQAKKLDEKSTLSESEINDSSSLLQSLINFFEEKNISGLQLRESQLFNLIARSHEQKDGAEFVPAIHEEYVRFALPIINDIYTSQSTSKHALVLLLFSCGDAWVRYKNVNQTKEFADFVTACRISLRNPLMHTPNFSFLDVTAKEIDSLCLLAQQAIIAQGLSHTKDWSKTVYGQKFIKSITASLSACGLFAGTLDKDLPGKKVLDYLGYTTSI